MSDPVKKTADPCTHGAFDARFVAEESSVRRRAGAQQKRSAQGAPVGGAVGSENATPLGETVGQRAARIARKIDLAERILLGLDRGDPLYRMLTSAVFRRDEVLLDAVLRAHATRR